MNVVLQAQRRTMPLGVFASMSAGERPIAFTRYNNDWYYIINTRVNKRVSEQVVIVRLHRATDSPVAADVTAFLSTATPVFWHQPANNRRTSVTIAHNR